MGVGALVDEGRPGSLSGWAVVVAAAATIMMYI
jgi:hypothetical protein